MKDKGIYLLIVFMLLGCLSYGCSDKEEDVVDMPQSERMNLVVTLQLDQASLHNIASRDLQDMGSSELTSDECAINQLTLYVTKITGGKEEFDSSQTLDKPDVTQQLRFELPVETGLTKRFYLIANMPSIEGFQFTGDKSVCTLPDEFKNVTNSYSNADYVMNIDDDGKGSNIMMTARITDASGKQDIAITGETIELKNPVQLIRVVSKILLTGQSTSDHPQATDLYMKLSEGIDGWVKFADMHYMVNTFDNEFYLFSQSENGVNKDINCKIEDFVQKNVTSGKYEFINSDTYNTNFLSFSDDAMVDMLPDLIGNHFKVLPYVASRMPKTGKEDNPYTEGLYCLENLVQTTNATDRPSAFLQMNKFFTTHLVVTAKYTPKQIYTMKTSVDGTTKTFGLFTASTENEMITELKGGMNNGQSYPDGTFWYYNNMYFSLEGIQTYLQTTPNVTPSDVKCYEGGWGFYATFIDGNTNANGIVDYHGQTAWGLVRDNYYILKLEKLTPPGSPIPGNKIMLLPTLEPWKNIDENLEVH